MALTEAQLNEIIPDGIDPANPGIYADLLNDLQGNILKAHGRDHSVHLFVKFTGNPQAVKAWLQDFATESVTSAATQARRSKFFKKIRKRLNNPFWRFVDWLFNISESELAFHTNFVNLFLSRKGYQYLDSSFDIPGDDYFMYGMKASSVKDLLGDPVPEAWETGYQKDLHALILIANDSVEVLEQSVERVRSSLAAIANVVQQEYGFVLRNSSDQVIEHFGFADGVSQPLFMKSDVEHAEPDGFDQWDPRAPLDLVLLKDPNGKTADSYGSYLAYRKLEQDVPAFRAAEQAMADRLKISTDLAGAYMVGRFKDGTPVTLSQQAQDNDTNNFNFNVDPGTPGAQPSPFDGNPKPLKCPFFAHIRKTNPRGDTARVETAPNFDTEFARERSHRIARRAISYGETNVQQTGATGSGLLFLCFQSDISGQFGFMQSAWANQNNFVKVNVGNDPIIGVTADGEASPAVAGNRQWLDTWGQPDSTSESELLGGDEHTFKIWVHLKGGEFFFAPSISFLTNLTT